MVSGTQLQKSVTEVSQLAKWLPAASLNLFRCEDKTSVPKIKEVVSATGVSLNIVRSLCAASPVICC